MTSEGGGGAIGGEGEGEGAGEGESCSEGRGDRGTGGARVEGRGLGRRGWGSGVGEGEGAPSFLSATAHASRYALTIVCGCMPSSMYGLHSRRNSPANSTTEVVPSPTSASCDIEICRAGEERLGSTRGVANATRWPVQRARTAASPGYHQKAARIARDTSTALSPTLHPANLPCPSCPHRPHEHWQPHRRVRLARRCGFWGRVLHTPAQECWRRDGRSAAAS